MTAMLVLDVVSRVGGAAVVVDGEIRSVVARDPGAGDFFSRQSRHLLPDVIAALEEACVKPEEVEFVAVTGGPGSYTGIRVGLSFAKGLLHGRACRAVSLCTCEMLSRRYPDHAPLVQLRRTEWIGRRDEVYVSLAAEAIPAYAAGAPLALLGDPPSDYRGEILRVESSLVDTAAIMGWERRESGVVADELAPSYMADSYAK